MNMEAGTMFHGTSIPPQQLEQVRMWLVINNVYNFYHLS